MDAAGGTNDATIEAQVATEQQPEVAAKDESMAAAPEKGGEGSVPSEPAAVPEAAAPPNSEPVPEANVSLAKSSHPSKNNVNEPTASE